MTKSKNKFLTITLKYKDTEDHLPNVSRFLYYLTDSLINYNKNTNFGYSQFDIVGVYVDPDEMDIEEQNNENKKINNKVNKNSKL